MSFPVLEEGDNRVSDFIDDFKDTVGFANDMRGLAPREQFRCIKQSLRGPMLKIYEVTRKSASRAGRLETNEGAEEVMSGLYERRREFEGPDLDRKSKADDDWAALSKGNKTALQFLPSFEEALADCELRGCGKTEEDSFLGYLRKSGAQARAIILHDMRDYPKAGGGIDWRKPRS